MKAPWFLVSNTTFNSKKIIKLYAKRWKIEPYFRDLKDSRYGLGLEKTHIKSCERRDRLMLILALSYRLIILLGQAGEQIGLDKLLKVNTEKQRTHSLFRQGLFYYQFFFRLEPEEQEKLLATFNDLLKNQPFWIDLFGEEE